LSKKKGFSFYVNQELEGGRLMGTLRKISKTERKETKENKNIIKQTTTDL